MLRVALLWIVLVLAATAAFFYCLDSLIMHRLNSAGSVEVISKGTDQWV